jgi:hypothetical protein
MYFSDNTNSPENLRRRVITSNVFELRYMDTITAEEWLHYRRVANSAETLSEEIVALCHDLIEDGYATLRTLHQWGLTTDEIQAVSLLTRSRTNSYVDYVKHIIDNALSESPAGKLAVRVKLYDLYDHIHPNRINGIDLSLVHRYTASIEMIADAMWREKRHEQAGEAASGVGREAPPVGSESPSRRDETHDEGQIQRESGRSSLNGEDAVPQAS